ncbi:MAG: ribose-phosphate pyrophosphokinase [Christensenellaceae bacterium]|jgi:ribose-phosphate pyrophosphokinase|nr:ribose-phosphate pyrophosphokinase [Christensenellaceae bacterium]
MLLINGKKINTEKYPNNETKVKDFMEALDTDECLLELKYESDRDLISLMFAKKRLDEMGKKTDLFIWYMPYSRMDREIPGDLFTLKYACGFLSGLNFNEITVMEPHSYQTEALFSENGINIKTVYPTKEWLYQIMEKTSFGTQDHIVFPDMGAAQRYCDMDILNPLIFNKKRNPITGNIEDIELEEGTVNLNSHCIIIDDLCSKGGTFLSVGNTLKALGAKKVSLLVAHCENTIFEGRLLQDDSPIDIIYTSDSMLKKEHPKIKKLSLEAEQYGTETNDMQP